jgi:rhodanese-related sulfurtransferase
MNAQIEHYENKLAYEIDAADLFEALNKGERIVVIDARSKDGYALEHIPGALSLPHRTMDADTTAHLDKDTLYITYCDGVGCNASTKGALKMAKLGFRVKELMGGLDWWKRDQYTTTGSAGEERKLGIACFC